MLHVLKAAQPELAIRCLVLCCTKLFFNSDQALKHLEQLPASQVIRWTNVFLTNRVFDSHDDCSFANSCWEAKNIFTLFVAWAYGDYPFSDIDDAKALKQWYEKLTRGDIGFDYLNKILKKPRPQRRTHPRKEAYDYPTTRQSRYSDQELSSPLSRYSAAGSSGRVESFEASLMQLPYRSC